MTSAGDRVTTTAIVSVVAQVVVVPVAFVPAYMLNESPSFGDHLQFVTLVAAASLVVGLVCGTSIGWRADVPEARAVPGGLLAALAPPLLVGPVWVFSILPFDRWDDPAPDTALQNVALSLAFLLAGGLCLWGALRLLRDATVPSW
ncbi:hypothetical protein [Aeromicrobium sp. IC_218]|uniref:hypothetical protein n=1 Tax=Aeromicrobium sp. IC_218 TaxID=2545468 RepID=UPI00103B031F|nr:hypothetical protein [Aeromicrobium sp. IC_218]TCI98798.1 hypothetical protein E0W78_08575 [Aeromicrobium sp. IC_218]